MVLRKARSRTKREAVPKVVVVSCDNPTLLDAITASRGVCDCYTFTTSVLESTADFSCDSGPGNVNLFIVVLYPDD
jgi:hypothetical protein